jgi:hypothetical protein
VLAVVGEMKVVLLEHLVQEELMVVEMEERLLLDLQHQVLDLVAAVEDILVQI